MSDIAPTALVEACVTTVAEAVAAEAAGAGRLELCRDLDVGGLTPRLDTLRTVLSSVTVPVNVMVRRRPGSFVLAPGDVDDLMRDLGLVLDAGAHGVVLGLLDAAGQVAVDATRSLVEAARGLPVTFHRAFDEMPDPAAALADVTTAGVARILTGGGPGPALHGAPTLAELVRRSAGDVVIMAGGRVRADHAARLVAATGVREVHARAEAVPALVEALRVGA